MSASTGYSYDASVKSDVSDELINTYCVRPIAGLIVRPLFRTSVTPNQVTVAAMVSGVIAAACYAAGEAHWTLLAGVLLWTKDILDSADGQLARARGAYSRIGRFLDSIGDFVVNAAVFAALTVALTIHTGSLWFIPAGAAALFAITLRISYHVFYQVSFLHLQSVYALNRTDEELTDDDRRSDRWTQRLQQTYLLLYGWQDRLMGRIDGWCHGQAALDDDLRRAWYGDRTALRLSGFLGMGTELFVLVLFSLVDRLEWYLGVTLLVQNGFWLVCVLYRRWVLTARLFRGPRSL
jgi:phosphatidylglycerophosphate synthase